MEAKFRLCLIFFSFFSLKASGFPIFYSCENEILKSADKIDPKNLFEKILKMSKQEQDKILHSWCKGVEECTENLKTIVLFSNSSYDVAEKLFLKELEKLETEFTSKIDNDELLKSIFRTFF